MAEIFDRGLGAVVGVAVGDPKRRIVGGAELERLDLRALRLAAEDDRIFRWRAGAADRRLSHPPVSAGGCGRLPASQTLPGAAPLVLSAWLSAAGVSVACIGAPTAAPLSGRKPLIARSAPPLAAKKQPRWRSMLVSSVEADAGHFKFSLSLQLPRGPSGDRRALTFRENRPQSVIAADGNLTLILGEPASHVLCTELKL